MVVLFHIQILIRRQTVSFAQVIHDCGDNIQESRMFVLLNQEARVPSHLRKEFRPVLS